MSLAEQRWLRLFTLCALFFAQGIPWGFFAITLPGHLSDRGLELAALGSVQAMSYWPYVFKWAGGPLIDLVAIPRLGRRRPWIVFAQGMMAVTVLAMVAIDDVAAQLDFLLALVLVHTSFNALQNVATDALAIDLLDPRERGRANGFMYGSKWAGGMVGGFGLSFVLGHWGFHAAVLVQAILLGAVLAVPLLVRERASGPPPEPSKPREVWAVLRRVYAMRSPWLAALMMLVMTISTGMLSVVAARLYVYELHWKQEDYGFLVGGVGLFFGFVGSTVAGFFADWVGHRRLAAIASVLLGVGWVVFALREQWWHVHAFIYALAILEPTAQAIMIVAMWSVCMAVSVKKTAATQFAAYTSLTSLSQIIGARLLAPHVHDWWSYSGIYLAAAAFQIAIIAILPFIDAQQVRRIPE
ncbi:MAG TPA: MFS transporter [Kofleriaceae bacterium]|nr:MFS transporter [Kofleriaceae bacterium]